MDRHPLRRLEIGGQAEGGPDHRVELEDVLGQHVQAGGPVALAQILPLAGEGQRRDVVEQGVEPDVHPLLGVPGQRQPPFQRRPRKRDVFEAALDEGDRLVAAEVGHDEVGTRLVQVFELALEG